MKKSRSQPRNRKRRQRSQKATSIRSPRRSLKSKSATKTEKETVEIKGNPAPAVQLEPFRIENKIKKIAWMGTGTVLFGVLSIYFYIDILRELQNYYTLIFVIPIYAYVFGDVVLWFTRGVRAVEVTSSGLNIVSPGNKLPSHVALSDIGSVRVTRSFDGKTINILLHGAQLKRFLWMDTFSGPRVRIPEALFDKQEFAELLKRIAILVPSHKML